MQRRDPLGMTVGLGQTGVDHEAMAVLHQRMPHEAELGLLARPLAIEPSFRIGRRGMRLIGALLAVEIRLAVASAAHRRRFARAILRPKALHRRPRFVDREVIRAEQSLHPWLRQNRAQELGGDVALQQAIAVLGKRRVIPHRIVNADPHEPAEQKIELQPLHQLPLRADRIERLQKHRPQKLLGRDRRSTQSGVECRELAREPRQSLVHDQADRPQRVILADPRLQIDIAEQRPRPLVPAPHRFPPPKPKAKESQPNLPDQRLLQQPASCLLD